jgi:hypothetical protein
LTNSQLVFTNWFDRVEKTLARREGILYAALYSCGFVFKWNYLIW